MLLYDMSLGKNVWEARQETTVALLLQPLVLHDTERCMMAMQP